LHITGVDLTNTFIESEKLEKIGGLTGLRELYLPASMWTPFSDSPLDDNDDLKYLAGLKNLERLRLRVIWPTQQLTIPTNCPNFSQPPHSSFALFLPVPNRPSEQEEPVPVSMICARQPSLGLLAIRRDARMDLAGFQPVASSAQSCTASAYR
jgi:hypothetical protein